MNNKSSDKKEFYLTINLLYPREESLQFFFLKIVFLKLFVGILPLKMQIFLYAHSNSFYAIIFKVFLHLLKF